MSRAGTELATYVDVSGSLTAPHDMTIKIIESKGSVIVTAALYNSSNLRKI